MRHILVGAKLLDAYEAGLKYCEIHEILSAKGYTGTQDAIRGFLSKERRICSDMAATHGQTTELVDKKWLIQLLYKPLEKVKGITQDQLSAVLAAYPLAETVYTLVNGFKTLMHSNEPVRLIEWMDETTTHGIAEINTFISGLRRDLEAVINASKFDYNNGIAEGSINKLKLVKRIMYGRCSFALLRAKSLLLEEYTRIN